MSIKFRPGCQYNFVHRFEPALLFHDPLIRIYLNKDQQFTINERLTSADWMYIIQFTDMPRRSPSDDLKIKALREQGALHPHPDAIGDEAFQGHEFFDPRDLVQVKYEMLRRHRVDGQPVAEVGRRFGVSRQAFYKTETAFKTEGLPGLVPHRRGPRRAHKCTDEVLDFAQQWQIDPASDQTLPEAIQQRFGISIHPRSVERALGRRKKKPTATGRRKR